MEEVRGSSPLSPTITIRLFLCSILVGVIPLSLGSMLDLMVLKSPIYFSATYILIAAVLGYVVLDHLVLCAAGISTGYWLVLLISLISGSGVELFKPNGRELMLLFLGLIGGFASIFFLSLVGVLIDSRLKVWYLRANSQS